MSNIKAPTFTDMAKEMPNTRIIFCLTEEDAEHYLEMMGVKLTPKQMNTFLANCYYSDMPNFREQLEDLFDAELKEMHIDPDGGQNGMEG